MAASVPHCVARMQASWPPATSLALAIALAPARPALPRLGAACVPSNCADFPEPAVRARAFPACQTACSLSRLSLLSGAARSVSPRRLIDYCLPGTPVLLPAPTKTRDPARAGATVGRCLPTVRACQVWGFGVQHRRRSVDDCFPFSLEIWGSHKRRTGSAETLPLVVLRNHIAFAPAGQKYH
jgi:hypothetical protein